MPSFIFVEKLCMYNNNIDRIAQFFLGVILHERMSCKRHIKHMQLEIAKTIATIYRLKSMYLSAILLTLYKKLVMPYLHYCLLCQQDGTQYNHSSFNFSL